MLQMQLLKVIVTTIRGVSEEIKQNVYETSPEEKYTSLLKNRNTERYSIFMVRKIQYLKMSNLPTLRFTGKASTILGRN